MAPTPTATETDHGVGVSARSEPDVTTTRVVIPSAGTLEFRRRAEDGVLLGIHGEGTTYLLVDSEGKRHWSGVCVTSEELLANGMDRTVETAYDSWVERYRWSDESLDEVDGVLIRRDEAGRVIACIPGGEDPAPRSHRWTYTHDDSGPTHIQTPDSARLIATSAEGRTSGFEEGGVSIRRHFDRDGVQHGPGRPLHNHVDESGRLWAENDETGRPKHIFVWDGTRCLARIDGPVGAPLAAVFSLDPSATPVRVVMPTHSVRIPRDAYGEGLVRHHREHGPVPGLFGGEIHGGLVHLPLRRLDPLTGRFCEPDPLDGGETDPRRGGEYPGPLPAEPEPRSPYEVCRGDPVGRADPTGGISAGLIISDLTWSFQNNILSFFGIDWWFNLFASLIVAPFKGVGDGIDYDFFDSSGLTASDRHGGFGVRRGGIINAITGGRAFTTQHIVWSPDNEYAELEHGEVITFPNSFEPTHYGSILSAEPAEASKFLLAGMHLGNRDWVTANAVRSWSRHGGVGVPVAPGTLTPHFPSGGIHLDRRREDTRGPRQCPVKELHPAAVAQGTLEDRSFIASIGPTGLQANDRVVADDGTNLMMSTVLAVFPLGAGQRIQLDRDLGSLTTASLSLQEITGPASSESLAAGPTNTGISAAGATATYAPNDLLRITSGSNETVARVSAMEARLPLDRALPSGFGGPISVSRANVSPAPVAVTISGTTVDFPGGSRPAVGAVGVLSGGGTDLAVRVESHSGANAVALDVAIPGVISAASAITFRAATAGTLVGTRTETSETEARITYAPLVAGGAPDGSTSPVVLHFSSGTTDHLRILSAAPTHDILVLDRAVTGAAPFTVERFSTTGSAVRNLTRTDVVGLVVPEPARFSSAPAVFLTKVNGNPATAGTAIVSGVDVAAGVVRTTLASPIAGLEPGRPVFVGSRPAAIRRVRLKVTINDSFDLSASDLKLVALEQTGGRYQGLASTTSEIILQPRADFGTGVVDAPFPRFNANDVVRVTPPSGTPAWYRVQSASGGRITLADGPALGVNDAVQVEATATLNPVDGGAPTAATGGPYLGIEGTRSGTGATSTVSFAVWSSDALPAGMAVGIVDGERTRPTTVAAGSQDLELTFSESFDATGVNVSPTVAAPAVTSFLPTLALDGAVLLLEGLFPALQTGPTESLIAVAYEPGDVSATGTLDTGTLLVPEGESTEVSRSQSLTDHELTHTLQYARFGPLWFNIFPMLAMELPGILATDTELPEFSAFLSGTIETDTSTHWKLTIPNTSGVAIAVDDELQVVQGSRRSRVIVRAVIGSVFKVSPKGTNPPAGAVSVRKLQRDSWFDGFFAFFDLLTHGGLVNLLAGTTWGGIFWLIGKAFYGLGRAIGGSGDMYAAMVEEGGGRLTLDKEADAEHFTTAGRVTIRRGKDTVIRGMSRNGTLITLSTPITFSGPIQVAPYDTHDPGSPFDWYDYHPGTIDTSNPFRITVADGDGGSPPGFSPEDRVVLLYRNNTPLTTDVLSVSGTTVELLDPVNITGGETSVRIAKIGASDPLGNADSTAMVEMGMGWMKWIFDPYGQIQYAVQPQQEWSTWLLRVMRWILGTQNFSLLPFGYLWWGRLFPIMAEHETPIEQEASEESGDLYSPLARLFGEATGDGFASRRMVVGDIARYRYWPLDRTQTFVLAGNLDAPGVHMTTQLRTLPHRTTAGTGTNPPNEATQSDAGSDPGLSVSRVLVRPGATPVATPDPLGFLPSDLGQVPVSPKTQRMQSAYVAFTRAGDHRVTTDNNIFGAKEALDVHRLERQSIFFDLEVTDVGVRVAGKVIDDSNPGTSDRLSLVPFQRVRAVVTPNTSRTYELTISDPDGPELRLDGSLGLAAVGSASPPSAGPVTVELSRVHRSSNGQYPSGGLAFAGMHLGRDLHIPLRRFSVEIVNTVALRDSSGAELSALGVGADGFLLVPAPVTRPPAVVSIGGTPPAADAPNPVSAGSSAGVEEILGTSGSAFKVNFADGSPTGEVVMETVVGDGTISVTLTTTFTLA